MSIIVKKNKSKLLLYALSFLTALHVAIPAYVNSIFIEKFLPADKLELVGYLYTISAILSVIILLGIPTLLKKIGNFLTTLIITITSITSLLFLAFSQNTILVLASFIVYLIIGSVIYFNLDIFLEKYTSDTNTGKVRGIYLTISNTAWVIAPSLAGLMIIGNDYCRVYFVSALILLPFIIILLSGFRKFKDPIYKSTSIFKTIKTIIKNKNIYKIFMVKFFLSFFYAWMTIYTPIYLYRSMGFDWKIIGVIFTIMLTPFVLFELPLGKLADKKLGEKEILNCGIIIISISTMVLSFLTSHAFWIWGLVLFATRVGASAVEIASESYFFKHINAQDSEIISIFRIISPLAYSVAPLMASLALIIIDIRFLFLTLGIFILLGLKYSLTLKDTR